jgi:hypothetical protein
MTGLGISVKVFLAAFLATALCLGLWPRTMHEEPAERQRICVEGEGWIAGEHEAWIEYSYPIYVWPHAGPYEPRVRNAPRD